MTDILVKNGVKQELITQSAYGINISGYEEAEERHLIREGIVFAFIGTLAPHKGCHILIQAFLGLNEGDARLKIYGNPNDFPDYVAELKQAAQGCDAIEFCGTFPNGKIAEILAGIDALVVPSVWYENTPLVVYSALAAKCPVIASDFAGMSEVIRDGWNGLLFTPKSSQSLSRCLTSLMIQPELLNKLSKNCEPPKSISTYVNEVLGLYEEVDAAPRYNLEKRQLFEALNPSRSYGHVAGWAVVSQDEPKAIRIFDGDTEVGQTTRLLPRLDVQNGLNSSGMKINTFNFGFTVNLEQPTNLLSAILEIESKLGSKSRIPFVKLEVGQSARFSVGVIVGLDEANFSKSYAEVNK